MEREKTNFLGDAAVLLFPVDWPEPFGLVMLEAMACGTPVLAYRCRSVPEIIEYGVTGKVVNSKEEAIAALPAILCYDRRAVANDLKRDSPTQERLKNISAFIADC
jgi:glycosyltransferase involved in cell wall biosynthesis